MANVRLVMHLEATDGDVVWWTDSPDVAGLTAAADTLRDVLAAAESTVRTDDPDATFAYLFADEGTSGGDRIAEFVFDQKET